MLNPNLTEEYIKQIEAYRNKHQEEYKISQNINSGDAVSDASASCIGVTHIKDSNDTE